MCRHACGMALICQLPSYWPTLWTPPLTLQEAPATLSCSQRDLFDLTLLRICISSGCALCCLISCCTPTHAPTHELCVRFACSSRV